MLPLKKRSPTEIDFNLFSDDICAKHVFNKYILPVVFGGTFADRFLDQKFTTRIREFNDFVGFVKGTTDQFLLENKFNKQNALQVFEFWKTKSPKQESLMQWIARTVVLIQILDPYLTKKIGKMIVSDYEHNFLKRRTMWDKLLTFDLQAEKRVTMMFLKMFYEDISQFKNTTLPDPQVIQPQQSQSAAFDQVFPSTQPRMATTFTEELNSSNHIPYSYENPVPVSNAAPDYADLVPYVPYSVQNQPSCPDNPAQTQNQAQFPENAYIQSDALLQLTRY